MSESKTWTQARTDVQDTPQAQAGTQTPPRIKSRMRTRDEAVEMLRQDDPGTFVTKGFISRMIREGRIPYVRVGRKILINYDGLLDFLENGLESLYSTPMPQNHTPGIRRIEI